MFRRSPPPKPAHPGETQAEFELRVLHGKRLGAIRAPADLSLPVFPYPTVGEIKASPASADLRSHDAPIVDQGTLGSCVANCWSGGFEWLENALEPSVFFAASRLALYKWARDHDGTSGDVGTTDPTMAWVVANKGAPHESLWPYTISQFDVEPPSNVVTDAGKAKATTVSTVATTVAGIKAAINTPVPVMFTFDVYQPYEDATNNGGKIGMPSGGVIGGHCNMVVGYNDAMSNLDGSAGAFIVRNSWGTSWGDKGYGYMPYNYANQGLMASGYVITAESEITPPTPTPTPTPSGTGTNVNLTAAVRTYQPGID